MTVADLEGLYAYSCWANEKLFAVIDQLTDEQFTQTVAGSYGSIRNTLVHMMSAEWGWIDRCGGTPRGPALKALDYPTRASVRQQWTAVEGYVKAFLSTLSDRDLERDVDWSFGAGTHRTRLGDLLLHSIVHATHHRGQVSLLLRSLDVTPGNFDILYFRSRAVEAPFDSRG